MWAAQVADLSDAFRVITLDLPGHGVRAAERFTLDDAADAVARGHRRGGRRAGGGRRPVPRRLCRHAPRRAKSGARPRAGPGRRDRRAGRDQGGTRTGPSAGSWPRSTATGSRRPTAGSSGPAIGPAICRADRRRRVLGGRRGGGAALPRRPPLQAGAGGVRGAQPHHQRLARPALSASASAASWPRRRTPGTCVCRGRPTSRTSTDPAAFNRSVRRFAGELALT